MMLVEFNLNEANYLVVGEEPFFVLATCDDKHLVCYDRCPHRGGPLHLGKRDCRTGSLTCPWHETVFTERAMCQRGVPAVVNGDTVTAVFPCEEDREVHCSYRRIIANER